jgi:hypothetical protein
VRPPNYVSPSGFLGITERLYGTSSGIYGIAEYTNTDMRVVRSTDDGVSFAVQTQFTPVTLPYGLAGKTILPNGALFAASQNNATNIDVWFSPDLSTGTAPVKLPGIAASALPQDIVFTFPHSICFAALPNGNVEMVTALYNGGTDSLGHPAPRLFVRTYDPHGAVVSEGDVVTEGAPQSNWDVSGETLQPYADSCTALPDGTVLLDTWSYAYDPQRAGAGGIHRIVRVGSTTATFGPALSTVGWSEQTSMVRLPDGRVALGASRPVTPVQDRAFYLTTTDGLTWSAPHDLHPLGGNGQLLGALAVEPGGSLGALVFDNSALTFAMGSQWDFRVAGFESGVTPDAIFVEVPHP